MSSVRCVVFDIDDTLYLERDYVCSGFAFIDSVAKTQLGLEGLGEVAKRLFVSGERGRIFDTALRECGYPVTPDTVSLLVRAYREHQPSITLLPDAALCLRALRSRLELGCITGGPAASQRQKIEALELAPFLSVVVLTGELDPAFEKPHPRSFEIVQDRTQWQQDELLYVGDNPEKDFLAPHRLGWRTIRVRRPGSLHEAVLTPPFVEAEVNDLSNLPKIIA